ncbi:heme-dependent oxidative N-demethylase family protein [Chachezhania sediminis]|uniref:heme-dependent oxidative N-demethylase family protein n=1 Tax=Chachezhania sediminis TaxID=2599291 RepID=UPI00131A67A8|nr:DUF3445 domain-containing protein [Chachezhania sediminis]
MEPILQSAIPYDIDAKRPLPGIQPMAMEDWLLRDDAYAGQMALRDRLLADRRDDVLRLNEAARPAADELLQMVLAHVYPGAGDQVTRPDGVTVPIDRSDPLGTVGRLVQEDFNILQKSDGDDEHVLTGAVLCFPANWTLAEKFMKPLLRIHVPVPDYDENIARRVQRLFDGIQVGRPLWRFNVLRYTNPDLFQPELESRKRVSGAKRDGRYLRSERQNLLRLPKTKAVLFTIHTFVMDLG